MQYVCRYVEAKPGEAIPWERADAAVLMDVVTGGVPRQRTEAKAVWTNDALRIRFECEDDFISAAMTRRDDPLYDEDVVEVFIDEAGAGERYMELEINPLNAVFDAKIVNDLEGNIQVDTSWDAEGLHTTAVREAGKTTYEISIPFDNFEKRPDAGTTWRWNLYRIDADPSGRRHFWAWSPTGAVDFHRSERFGALVFAASDR
ncbi:carbohydrate-binding family 9-like protein [Paenibacillus sp.]|uniref:carbohydrate-binding family 9-like protein n=1 Tax=Paenibacillus sp. TaxID=58172 RepID=UPI00281126CB|nr:carbohydrate-binding family 9-like protein [Paenibacillus sp.]